MNKYIKHILEKQFSLVGGEFTEEAVKKVGWYMEYEWGRETEESFIEWMTDYLYRDKGAREAMMRVPAKNKKLIEKAVYSWVFNYGWVTKK